jgi:hypothetical protein
MLRLLEKLSWHYAGLELLAHGAHKCGGMTLSEPRKHRGAETTRFTIEVRMSWKAQIANNKANHLVRLLFD